MQASQPARPAVHPPQGVPPAWAQRIQTAKAAREMGRQIRAGKPTSFGKPTRSRPTG